ncbi:MAG: hypothetical protein LC667_18250 [Thioalkalivibrio sp.]|nr:hypothetical protein [Thioalkalivibrio sp.]
MLPRLRALLFVVVTGCAGSEASERDAQEFSDVEARRRAASPVREVAVSGSDASFTSVPRLTVDSRGFIYVPDTYQKRVAVLDPGARLVRSFGRRGSGPNEFRAITSVQALPGDSLLVYDPELGRLSIYPPDAGAAAYSISLGGKLPGMMPPWEVRRTHANDALIAHFRPGFAFGRRQDFSKRTDKVRVLNQDGSLRSEALSFPSQAFLVAGTSITPHPFGHEGFVRLDSQDRLHFVWSDTLAVSTRALDGSRAGGFRVEYASPALTRADVSDALARFPDTVRGEFEPVLADSTPERWPAVRQLLIDERDRLWFAMGGSRSREREWAAFSTEGKYLGSVLVPADSEVRFIRADGSLYAERLDENDVPHVVVYRMVRPLR